MGQAYLDGKYRLDGVLYLDGQIPDREANITASSSTVVGAKTIGKGEVISVSSTLLGIDGFGSHTILGTAPVTAISLTNILAVKGAKKEVGVFSNAVTATSHFRPVIMTLFGEQVEEVVSISWVYEGGVGT